MMKRRNFTKSAMVASAVLASSPAWAVNGMMMAGDTRLKKGIMWGSIRAGRTAAEKFHHAKMAGFEGVEVMSHLDRNEVLQARDETGLAILGVCNARHWRMPLSDPDPAVREEGVEALWVAIDDAKIYGTDTVLLVPGIVNEKVSYDACWQRTIDGIKKVLPMAEKHQVRIAIENVNNRFLLSPLEACRYVDQFNSKWVGFYFDTGNALQCLAYPEQWIRILGNRILRVHIKDYSLKILEQSGIRAGYQVRIGEGDVNWTEVMRALNEISYHGWLTVEQAVGGDTPEEVRNYYDRLTTVMGM